MSETDTGVEPKDEAAAEDAEDTEDAESSTEDAE